MRGPTGCGLEYVKPHRPRRPSRIAESALRSRLRPEFEPRPTVANVVAALQYGRKHPPIGELADRAVNRIGSGPPPRGWAQFATDCGYADRGHMIREFQSFSGLTPVQHLSSKRVATKSDHVALAA